MENLTKKKYFILLGVIVLIVAIGFSVNFKEIKDKLLTEVGKFSLSPSGSSPSGSDENPEGYDCMRLYWVCYDPPPINIFLDATCYYSGLSSEIVAKVATTTPETDCKDLRPLLTINESGEEYQAREYLSCEDCDISLGCCYSASGDSKEPKFIGFMDKEECEKETNQIFDMKCLFGTTETECQPSSWCEGDILVTQNKDCSKTTEDCSKKIEVDRPHCEEDADKETGEKSAKCKCDPGLYPDPGGKGTWTVEGNCKVTFIPIPIPGIPGFPIPIPGIHF